MIICLQFFMISTVNTLLLDYFFVLRIITIFQDDDEEIIYSILKLHVVRALQKNTLTAGQKQCGKVKGIIEFLLK